MNRAGVCLDCGESGWIEARGLDSRCYQRRWRAGTLDERPRVGQPPSGKVRQFVAGLTYRRLDHWTRLGYLRADDPTPGIGRNRTWPETERQVAALMVRLTAAGLTVEAAHRVARLGGRCQLAPGITIAVAQYPPITEEETPSA